MTIRASDYGKKKRGKLQPVMVNVRLAPDDGHKPTRDELERVLNDVRDTGTVPSGWRFAGIEWKNPAKASRGWTRGAIDDLDKFLPVLRAMPNLKLRAAEAEGAMKEKKLSEKKRRRLEREAVLLDRKLAAPRRRHRDAIRERDRRKTREARVRWERLAERESLKIRKLGRKRERLLDQLYGEPEVEYELAVDYKRRAR